MHPHFGVIFEVRGRGCPVGPQLPPQLPVTTPKHLCIHTQNALEKGKEWVHFTKKPNPIRLPLSYMLILCSMHTNRQILDALLKNPVALKVLV